METMNPSPTRRLSDVGVSIWLDDLSREMIDSGELARRIRDRDVVGVTTNPAIFRTALSGTAYDTDILRRRAEGQSVEDTALALMVRDVQEACDLLLPEWERTAGADGRVSLEVSPTLSGDADATVAQAERLWNEVARPNAMIKVPATDAGLNAIRRLICAGISVNVTLIFGRPRYLQVLDAYLDGLEAAHADGRDLSAVRSVASFFVSRIDSEVDRRLGELAVPAAYDLKTRVGTASAALIYHAHREALTSGRWRRLSAAGAHPQRPLWASTGVKDPAIPDTAYAIDLAGPGVVNTMPRSTLDAVYGHGEVLGDTLTDQRTTAPAIMGQLAHLGIDMEQVAEQLEQQGLAAFETAWSDLLDSVRARSVTSRHDDAVDADSVE